MEYNINNIVVMRVGGGLHGIVYSVIIIVMMVGTADDVACILHSINGDISVVRVGGGYCH